MKTLNLLLLSAVVSASPLTSRADELRAGIICAGAATLNNGSVVTLGQSFVGVMSAPDGLRLNLGLLTVTGSITNVPPSQPTIDPAVRLVNGTFQFSFQTQPGHNYVIEASTNLSAWTPIWTNFSAGTEAAFQDMETGTHPQRFYRVLLLP